MRKAPKRPAASWGPGRFPLSRALLLAVLPAVSQAATIYKFTDAHGVVNYTDRQTPGAQVLVFRDRMVEHLEQQVHLDINRSAASTTFTARNELYAPVEVELTLSGLSNVQGQPPSSVHGVVPPRGSVTLAILAAQQPGKWIHYTQQFKYALGDPSLQPIPYAYPLPWKGGPFRVSQGPNGRYSHTGAKSRYAIDIAMPRGTPIVAARSGVVVKVENSQAEGDAEASGNFVRVLHDDGTMGVYLHLTQGSVSVKEGQHVEVGTPLARSGNTGSSNGPHLHFVVQRNVGLALQSIPYDFDQPLAGLPGPMMGQSSAAKP